MNVAAKSPEPQKKLLALPPIFRAELEGERLTLVRPEEVADDVSSILELKDQPLISFNRWQHEVLQNLHVHGTSTFELLIEMVKDRLEIEVDEPQIRGFFLQLDDLGVLKPSEAENHPLVSKILIEEEEQITGMQTAKEKQAGTVIQKKEDKKGFPIFRPMWLLKLLRPLFVFGPFFLIALPPLTIIGLFVLFQNADEVLANFGELQRNYFSLVTLLLVGLLTVNLAATCVYAASAYSVGATVQAVAMRFYFGFVPRLTLWIDDTEKLSRKQAMWLHAAPLFTRLFIAGAGMLFWNTTRHLGGSISDVSLWLSMIALGSFLITACPFYRGHGYELLVEFLDEPYLRAKAFKALFNQFNPKFYQNADSRVLIAYALVSILFMVLITIGAFFIFKNRFELQFGAQAYLLLGVALVAFIWRVWVQLGRTNELYWQNYRFERWRDRTLPTETQKKIEGKNRLTMWRVLRLMLITAVGLVLLQPYPYRPSGSVTLLPNSTRELSSDIEGIVAEVNFQGGEMVGEGTLIAALNTDDFEAQLAVQKAQLNELQIAYDFARTNCERDAQLVERGAIPTATYERTLQACTSAEAELEVVRARIVQIEGQIRRSKFFMPFDGQLGSLYLEDRLGSFLREGEPIATVSDNSTFQVRLEVREVDLALVQVGDPIEVRVFAYPDRIFEGEILKIDSRLAEDNRGNLIEAIASIDNEEGLLQTGMSGFAKAEGEERPIWRILTQSIRRFITIDLWAWLP